MVTSLLNYYISIEKGSTIKDSVGAPASLYTVLSNVWASKYIRSVDTRFMTEGALPMATTEWTIRFRDDVDIKCRIISEGDIYKILSVEKVGRREALKITTVLYNE